MRTVTFSTRSFPNAARAWTIVSIAQMQHSAGVARMVISSMGPNAVHASTIASIARMPHSADNVPADSILMELFAARALQIACVAEIQLFACVMVASRVMSGMVKLAFQIAHVTLIGMALNVQIVHQTARSATPPTAEVAMLGFMPTVLDAHHALLQIARSALLLELAINVPRVTIAMPPRHARHACLTASVAPRPLHATCARTERVPMASASESSF